MRSQQQEWKRLGDFSPGDSDLPVHEQAENPVAELAKVVGLLFEGVLLAEDGSDGGLVVGEGVGVGKFGLDGFEAGGGDFLEGGGRRRFVR